MAAGAPQTYVVQSGDTLSAIGAKFGVNYNQITGYKSGNPNLIYPGETLTIPGGSTTPTATPTPTPTSNPAAPTPQPTTPSPTTQSAPSPSSGGATPPPYAPNVVNQTVSYNGVTWKGNPGTGWTQESSGGTGSTGGLLSAAPTIDLQAITQAAYNTPEIQAANKAITDRQQALADATAGINDNPFYSEATRVGKVAKLTQEANADITVQQNTLASLKSDAAIKVQAAQGQYNIDNTAYQENLKQFQDLLNGGALDNASASDLSNLAISTGIPISEIQSMVEVQSKKDNPASKVNIVQTQDSSGQLVLVGVDETGTVVSTTTIPGTTTTKPKTTGTTPATQKPADQTAAVAAIVADYLHNESRQAQISPEDLYKELLLQYPGAQSYISKYWTADIIRQLET